MVASKAKEAELDPITISEIKDIARQRIQKPYWNYFITGADEEKTLQRNQWIYDEVLLRPRMLRDVSNVDTSTAILGRRYNIPIAISPTGYQRLAGHGGEVDIARAAFALGTNFTLSSSSTTSLEHVAKALPPRDGAYPRPWFQLYFLRSRGFTADLIRRAEKAGYEAVVLTIDSVVIGNRMHERRQPLELPPGIKRENMAAGKGAVSTRSRLVLNSTRSRLVLNAKTAAEAKKIEQEHGDTLVDASLCWHEVIPWLRSQTDMKIILKGIMTEEDALRAVEAGVDAIVVSNHGGRQLDGAPSTLEVLPEVADAVRGKIPVIFDGGISRGTDVFKALALGADLCMIGRSALWGLAWDGQMGVERVLHILEREFSRTMASMGAASLKDISRSMLGRAKKDGFGIAKL